jgi:hypothetical protein
VAHNALPVLSFKVPETDEPEEELLEFNDTSSTSTARLVPDVHVSPPTPAMTTFPLDTPWRQQSHRGSYKDQVDDYDEGGEEDLVVHSSGNVPAEQDPLFNPGRTGRRGSYDPDETELEDHRNLSDQQVLEEQRGVMEGQ